MSRYRGRECSAAARKGLFATAACVSMLALVTLSVLWVRSYWATDYAGVADVRRVSQTEKHWRAVSARSVRGAIAVYRNVGTQDRGRDRHSRNRRDYSPPHGFRYGSGPPQTSVLHMGGRPPSFWNRLGFQFRRDVWGNDLSTPDTWTSDSWHLVLPYWFLAALAALFPGLWLVSYRRRSLLKSRLRRGLCGRCGYDLRGTPAARCPECGVSVAERGSAALEEHVATAERPVADATNRR